MIKQKKMKMTSVLNKCFYIALNDKSYCLNVKQKRFLKAATTAHRQHLNNLNIYILELRPTMLN